MTLVKICGVTNTEDALLCAEAGADMLGFNFYPRSPRYVAPEAARRITERLPATVTSVGVFVNEESPARVEELATRAGVTAVQLHGDEPAAYCRALEGRLVIKALRVSPGFVPGSALTCGAQSVLLDAYSRDLYGGTGEVFDWSAARSVRALVPRLFLAGGLGPENAAEAVRAVAPYAVDACSLLERAHGRKDAARVRAFVAAVRRADGDAAMDEGAGKIR
ncbi:MAG TPA: phosphoribosylanthranilate isomerase [Pyrinomonadaceae bacterium]|nr:phosphoribosylanthranilate isomerase [Pyrinomonadaceae bacterium]